MKNLSIFLVIITFFGGLSAFAQTNCECENYNFFKNEAKVLFDTHKNTNTPEDILNFKKYVNKIEYNRATIYNALNLSDEQIEKREYLAQQNASVYEKKFDNLLKESFKTKALKDANASNKEISQQEKVVNNIKKDIYKTLKCENKAFKKSLTHEQRSKYAMITKLERKDYKEAKHQKNYYKSNPKLQPFGNPKKS